ncbi:DUF2254 domain-containing protein [Nocardioides ferulae]|uniref:DUF2254 domain-containing protein n=1 Tax=Nocardioides ferulae TaxID=2340821 RepID=UPI0013DE13B8|nr:DUF2254 domain-containing protein [Nocardioides ferulae]
MTVGRGSGPEAPGRAHRLVRASLGPFWVVPSLWCIGAVGLGLVLPELDEGTASWMPLLFQGGPEGARTVLSSVAGAMISVTGLVFSITIVVLQLASSQFSPRVLGTFLEDRVTQHTLGVFAASFLYSLTVLRSIVDVEGRAVPQLAVTASYLWVLGAVGMFLAFIHHITRSIAVDTIVRRTAGETRALLVADVAARAERPPTAQLPDAPGEHVVTAACSGYLDVVDLAPLVRCVEAQQAWVDVLHPLGTFVVEGSPLAVVHGAGPGTTAWDEPVRSHLHLRGERTLQQDVSFGFRRMVDIGERALSPGTNDPTTAVQVIDQLHDLLRRLAGAPDPAAVAAGEDGAGRVVLRPHRFADLLDLAVDELAHWGAESLQVPRRLRRLLHDLRAAALPEHRPTVDAKLAQVTAATPATPFDGG